MVETPELPYSGTLISRVRAVHRALDDAGFPHAFGGAIALGVHVEPRATSDMDINVIATPEQVDDLLGAMPEGVVVPPTARDELRERGQIRLQWPGPSTPVDLFLPQHETYHQLVNDRAVPAEFLDRGLRVVSATDLMVFKMLFDRRKDWADIAAMVGAGVGDTDDASRWVTELVGPDDRRLAELQAVIEEQQVAVPPPGFPPPVTLPKPATKPSLWAKVRVALGFRPPATMRSGLCPRRTSEGLPCKLRVGHRGYCRGR